MDDHANDAQVQAAKDVAAKELEHRLKGPIEVSIVSAEKQVVAGTNYRLVLQVKDSSLKAMHFKATVWERLPHEGGKMELTDLSETTDVKTHGLAPKELSTQSEQVKEAATFAIQQLSAQSNSLLPLQLIDIESAYEMEGETPDALYYKLKLKARIGESATSVYETDVEIAPHGGKLLKSQVDI